MSLLLAALLNLPALPSVTVLTPRRSRPSKEGHFAVDITGKKFGRLLVTRRGPNSSRRAAQWWCVCECGKEVLRRGDKLWTNKSPSCGCERWRKHGETKGPRGSRSRTKEYRAWWAMIARCTYPSQTNYTLYGGRGITVCPEWRVSFESFLADVGRAPSPKHTLDRINPDGHYESNNVRWATWTEQRLNQRGIIKRQPA
jgi:hypothetical protein